jgi:23S rRNA pseudouridine2605 synthase
MVPTQDVKPELNDDIENTDEKSAAAPSEFKKIAGPQVRLNKLIADSGLVSRRKADGLIAEGRVVINGKKVYELGIKVDSENDRVVVDGKPLRRKFEAIYIMFYKPTGVLTTMFDPLERPTVKDFCDNLPARVFPIGRLDWDSEGLLLLTNDGDYANRVMHPKEEVTKTYLVKLNKTPKPEQLEKLLRGVPIVGGRVKANHIEKLKRGGAQYPWIKIIISEGKNRQIRQMFEKIGLDVMKLQRVAIGRLRLGSLERGGMLFLNDVAAERVFQADTPEDVKLKKSYKGRQVSSKKLQPSSSAPKTRPPSASKPKQRPSQQMR